MYIKAYFLFLVCLFNNKQLYKIKCVIYVYRVRPTKYIISNMYRIQTNLKKIRDDFLPISIVIVDNSNE